ncbi:acetoacetate--CoA ligase [Herbidospora mongoliensis]|uniref:acetoacetate--CoA ligase n=1 Tax=Herbidospora mongoliensis TaxID=688067 RepID=UPI00083009E7|nr:acetoacetate--CoA ligase [Herbidospora mongoliensis]
MVSEGDVLWVPSAEVIRDARITRFQETVGRPGSYDGLWSWSVGEPAAFWTAIWDYFGVIGDRADGPVIDGEMPGTTWFPGSLINYAENALKGPEDRLAVIFRDETGVRRTYTLGQLRDEVAKARAGLVELGVGAGDRVAGYLPNIPEALIAFLATASLGAIWSSCSPDFGAPSVIDRLTQIEPKVLIAVDGYTYNGKYFDRREVVADIAARLPSLNATVRVSAWDSFVRPGDLAFDRVPFDHPLWILYSSGTTGLPKPIVHGHGGIVVEHLKALTFHQDLGEGDLFFWYTTTGWMMWNYLAGGLLVGATIVLYDGSAAHPSTSALWDIVAEEGVTYFGTGAPYIVASMKAGLKPAGLDRLKGIGSTGSPLPPEGFAWIYADVSDRVQLGSFSGGTDVCTGFVGAVRTLPVRAGVIPCRSLGARVESFDAEGRPVIGEVGELVVTAPMPSMPVMFWNDPDGHRYRESYFEEYPGIWRHGDWIKILPDGSSVIYGRSDSTLNRGGVRMGTSEFYRVVERFDAVADSLVIDTGRLGQEGRLLLYVALTEGRELDETFVKELKTALRTELSPRHVPDAIVAVPGIPRTLSGKKLEVPVRKILQGVPVEKAANPDAMANPEVLAFFTPLADA